MKKKYIVLLLIIAVSLAVTPAAFRLAYLQRGYKALGGEIFVPVIGAVMWNCWQDLKAIFNQGKYGVQHD